MASVIDESQSLRGNVLFHPAFVTPHTVPVFLRSAALRVAAGTLLMAGVFAAIVALAVNGPNDDRLSCALASATCLVAFYHYSKLISIRDQSAPRIKLSKPGDVPMGQPSQLKWSWQELEVDAVRYSDWMVTLGALTIDLHILNGQHTRLFPVAWSVVLCGLMVACGAFTRLGTDELVPPTPSTDVTKTSDGWVRILGVVSFVVGVACLFLVLFNLLDGLDDPSNGWVFAFSIPWVGYGVIALIGITWRQIQPDGYSEGLSIMKDLSYALLDIWSKAVFAYFIGVKALGFESLVFGLV